MRFGRPRWCPLPSHTRILMRSARRLRNTSTALQKGSCASVSFASAASESAPLRKSTGRGHQHPYAGWNRNHRAAFTARSTSRRRRQSTPSATRITAPAISISTMPACVNAAVVDGLGSFCVATTGTNPGASSADSDNPPPRASRRRAKTCCGRSPYRCATAETFAPAANDSATIRPLSSCDHARRPPRR